jgi:hypothetical protein
LGDLVIHDQLGQAVGCQQIADDPDELIHLVPLSLAGMGQDGFRSRMFPDRGTPHGSPLGLLDRLEDTSSTLFGQPDRCELHLVALQESP